MIRVSPTSTSVFSESRHSLWVLFRKPWTLHLSASSIRYANDEIRYLDLRSVDEQPALRCFPRWRGASRLVLVYGASGKTQIEILLPGSASANANETILRIARSQLEDLRERIQVAVSAIEVEVEKVYKPDRYVRHSQAKRLEVLFSAKAKDLLSKVLLLKGHPLLSKDARGRMEQFQAAVTRALMPLIDTESFRTTHNNDFLNRYLLAERAYFDSVESSALTPEQVNAALIFEDANLVVAAAGSGKSSCIVAKIGFALKIGMFQESEILALAYNKEAALSLSKRLSSKLGKALGRTVHVKAQTFHAFGLATMLRAEGPEYELRVFKEEGDEEGRLLKSIISELIEGNEAFQQAFAEWLLYAPFHSPNLIGAEGDLEECERRYEEICRQHIRAKIQGASRWDPSIPTLDPAVHVRSLEERAIANWLLLRGVKFNYEKYDHDGAISLGLGLTSNNKQIPYRPDFTYFREDQTRNGRARIWRIVHEHFGLNDKGRAPEWLGGEKYEEQAARKRQMFAQRCRETKNTLRPVVFIETRSGQMRDGSLWNHLEAALRAAGISVGPPSAEAYRKAIASFGALDDREKLIVKFVMQFRDSGHAEDQVYAAADEQANPWRARLFLKVAFMVAEAYKKALAQMGKIDYSDMLHRATDILRSGRVKTQYRFLLVDEFQDISKLRANLVRSALDQAPEESVLFCVGDDWQTINRFAGSDVGIFTNLGRHFGRHVRQQLLPRTFRCSTGIASVARAIVLKNPTQLDKPVEAGANKIEPYVRVVLHDNGPDQRVAALKVQLELIAQSARSLGQDEVPTVQVLTRTGLKTKTCPEGLSEQLMASLKREYAGQLSITAMNLHSSKGLEADFVVIIGLDSGFRGFPDERQPEPLLDLVLPKLVDENEEERRLFYVGLTRARHQVVLLANAEAPSRYILDLQDLNEEHIGIEWESHDSQRTPCPSCREGSLLVRPNSKLVQCSRSARCGYRTRTDSAGALVNASVAERSSQKVTS